MDKVVFFDFFGVICKEISPFWLQKRFSSSKSIFLKEEIVNRGDTGEYSEEEVFIRLSQLTGVEPLSIRNEWVNSAILNKETVNFILELKKDYKVYLLSNAMENFIEDILSKFDLYHLFDDMFISAKIKKAKPNKDYFEYVLDYLKLSSEQCIFMDDNPKNVLGARSVGIKTIQFDVLKIEEIKSEVYSFLKE